MGRASMNRCGVVWLALSILLLVAGCPWRMANATEVSLEYGRSTDKDVRAWRFAYGDDFGPRWRMGALEIVPAWQLAGGHSARVGELSDSRDGFWELAARLVFTVQADAQSPVFFQVGTGPEYITAKVIGTTNLGNRLEFRSHVGIGLRFGRERRYFLLGSLQHASNGGLSDINPGINYATLALGLRY